MPQARSLTENEWIKLAGRLRAEQRQEDQLRAEFLALADATEAARVALRDQETITLKAQRALLDALR